MTRELQMRTEGRNLANKLVLVARCGCGWTHMTAYRRNHKRKAQSYLCGRFNAHPCIPDPEEAS